MKCAAPPCTFRCFNKNNKYGDISNKYKVTATDIATQDGPTSLAVSGNLYIDQIAITGTVTVLENGIEYTGLVSFVFAAEHWALTLDGHPTLAEQDVAESEEEFLLSGIVEEAVVVKPFALAVEIETSGQAVWDDWSQT
jgi:hypothetical protein